MKTTPNSGIPSPDSPVIEAAGGILWRETQNGPELALVHRERYDDWSLPKGKREPGETWQETALREVFEETGLRAELVDYAGAIGYPVGNRAKVVLYWKMRVTGKQSFVPNDEVDRMVWLPIHEAIKKATYADERILLQNQQAAED
ncbi:MAG TPA: NUDIX hydrolase [Anaerolineales bacterium]|nr:NUDIX hydrolase [Anaerolineales bacterium]